MSLMEISSKIAKSVAFKALTTGPLVFCVSITTQTGHATTDFAPRDDFSPGTQSLYSGKNPSFWFRTDVLAIDGSVTTSPPDVTKYDRRAEAQVIIGGHFVLASGSGINVNAKALSSSRRIEEATPPRSPVTSKPQTATASIDYTFITSKGLETFIGMYQYSELPFVETQESEVASSTTTYNSATLQGWRAGLLKRGGSWAAGFYMQEGKEIDRDFIKEASDGTSFEESTVVHKPTEYGVVARFGEKSNFTVDVDLTSIQAGEGGELSEDGNSVRDDFIRAYVAGRFDLGGSGFKIALGHQTLSYADNAYVDIDTIPVSYVKTIFELGDNFNNFFFGAVYASGHDGQSITEFNADYKIQAGGLTTGFLATF